EARAAPKAANEHESDPISPASHDSPRSIRSPSFPAPILDGLLHRRSAVANAGAIPVILASNPPRRIERYKTRGHRSLIHKVVRAFLLESPRTFPSSRAPPIWTPRRTSIPRDSISREGRTRTSRSEPASSAISWLASKAALAGPRLGSRTIAHPMAAAARVESHRRAPGGRSPYMTAVGT